MSTTRLLIVLAAICLLVASCGSDATIGAGAGDSSSSPTGFDGEWTLVESEIDGAPFSSVASFPITLEITGDQLRGNASCNGYGGDFSVEGTAAEGTVLVVGDVSITEMACMDNGAMDAEQTYIQAFWNANGIERTGIGESERLVITSDGITLNYAPTALISPPDPEAALVGTLWILDTIIDGDTASSALADVEESTLKLAEDGTFAAMTGCRELTGSYTLGPETELTFGYDMEDYACEGSLGDQESQVLAVLDQASTVSIDDQRLTLTTTDGSSGLSYKAAQ